LNGSGAVWKQVTDKAETETSVVSKHLDDKVLFTGILRQYVAIHREMKNTSAREHA
jgi:hypothetical protein